MHELLNGERSTRYLLKSANFDEQYQLHLYLRAIGMRYLAQVHTDEDLAPPSGDAPTSFLLIAAQSSDDLWELVGDKSIVKSDRASAYFPKSWVLITLNDRQEVLQVEDAKPWIVDVVKTYLSLGVTPEFLRQETERAEQWRQSLTLQSQELDRRALELEARREQLQSLEADLKREKQELEDPEPSEET